MNDHGLDLAVIGNGRTAALVDPATRMVWWCFPALRRRPDLLPAVVRQRREGFSDVVLDDMAGFQVGVSPQYRDRDDGSDRSSGRRRCGSPILRRASISSAACSGRPSSSDHRAGGRVAADHHSRPADQRLRSSGHPPIRRQQSYPLRQRRLGHPAHHRCAAVVDRARGAVRRHPADAPGPRRGRAVSGRSANHLPGILRPHLRLLDGLGARGFRSPTTGRTRSSAPRSR